MTEADRQRAAALDAMVRPSHSQCCVWDGVAAAKVFGDDRLGGVLPEELKRLAVDYLRGGGSFHQKPETDTAKADKRRFGEYVYQISFPVAGLPKNVFMKIVLLDDDTEYPEVVIVGAHLTSF